MNATQSFDPRSRVQVMVIAFVLAAGMLAYEILLTRIASVLLMSEYVFLVISFALLGISIGAILEYRKARKEAAQQEFAPAMWLIWSAVVLAAAIILVLLLGADRGLIVLALAAGLPFVASGYFFSRMFRLFSHSTGILYAADLGGAALGALTVPLLLPAFGPSQSILLLSALLASVGLIFVFVFRHRTRIPTALVVFVVTAGLWALNQDNRLFGDVPVGKHPDKDLYRLTAFQGDAATIVDSRWSTFGRTDLVRFEGDSSMMTLFIDGAAGMNMLRFTGSFDDFSPNFTHAVHQFGGIIPLLNLDENQKDNALVIGPGGGRDILLALKAGFKKITAVEINPQVVAIGRDYREFNGGIFDDNNNVEVVIGEGRNFLRNSSERYDLITLFMPITKSSRGLNAFALSENYLFTKEAFTDYHRHLTDEGSLLIMAHGMSEMLKLLTTAIEALQAEGLTTQQAMSHLYILGSEMMPLFGMHKNPLQPKESEFLHAAAHRTIFNCQYSYIPGVEQQLIQPSLSESIDAGIPMMNPFFINLASGKFTLDRLERGSGYNLVPASDDSPFFSRYGFNLPGVITFMSWISMGVIALLFFLGTRIRKQASGLNRRFTWWLAVFFTSIGIGYIVLELSLFQKLVFYLGDPSRSLALLLAALLIGSGVGSFFSRGSSVRILIWGGVAASAFTIVLLFLLPTVFSLLEAQPFNFQQGAAAVLLFLQGLPMGVMFPTALRFTAEHIGQEGIPWAWALNGAASVAGSALAIGIAVSYGYLWSLLFGAVWYLLAALSAAMLIKTSRALPIT